MFLEVPAILLSPLPNPQYTKNRSCKSETQAIKNTPSFSFKKDFNYRVMVLKLALMWVLAVADVGCCLLHSHTHIHIHTHSHTHYSFNKPGSHRSSFPHGFPNVRVSSKGLSAPFKCQRARRSVGVCHVGRDILAFLEVQDWTSYPPVSWLRVIRPAPCHRAPSHEKVMNE